MLKASPLGEGDRGRMRGSGPAMGNNASSPLISRLRATASPPGEKPSNYVTHIKNYYLKGTATMQKKFKIEVDCANCAAKIETAIKALPGVKNASVSFMAQKLLLEADDDKFDAVLKDAVKTAKKVEPDFEIEL